MKIFDAQATRDALPFSTLIPALRDMFVAGCEVPARQVHEIAASAGKETLASGHPKGERMTSLVMPAWQSGRHYGIKVVNVAPQNAARALPGLHSSYLLFDATTGVPQALIDGSVITARRTAAASALAATFVARGDAQRLLLVGAGAVARLLPEAYRTVLPIKQVTVWARS
ncbi:MAG: ornithine cyclodeaminase family protein, partial [Rubrivivax sp.]